MSLPSDPGPERSDVQIFNNAAYQLEMSNTGHAAVSSFLNANDVRIKDSTLSMNVTNNIQVPASTKPALDVLYKRVAPHAILNKGGRADDAKCHPGTRNKVIGLVEKWMDDANSDRVFWMSGPAGGGKTAIMKTIAERSADRGAWTINFFFFRGDSTRDSAQPVVATLLYQLFRLFPSSLAVAAEVFSKRPRILDESLDEQCTLISALFPIIRKSAPAGPSIVLLIDGLDECDAEGETSQPDILRAFEHLVTQADSPFRLLVASRREARIQMTFNELPSRAQSIFLSEEYSPEDDIRIFVQAEFTRIKASHPSSRSMPSDWPSSLDIEAIVTKSSGQFIYAATAMRYISDPDTVPTLSLEQVMGIVSTVNNSPFTSLDNIYMFILNQSTDRDATRDVLSVKLIGSISGLYNHMALLGHYNTRYHNALIESCISKLSSIVQLDHDGDFQFYHASLTDFLVDHTRSGAHWIDVDAFRTKVMVAFWRKHLVDTTVSNDLLYYHFTGLQKPNPDLTHMLLNMSIEWMLLEPAGIVLYSPLYTIQKMYYNSDVKTYKHILRQVTLMAMSCGGSIQECDIPHVEEYRLFYLKWKWWFQLSARVRRKKQQS